MWRDAYGDQVLVPYKITLLSNNFAMLNPPEGVLVPYKITLLSNCRRFAVGIF